MSFFFGKTADCEQQVLAATDLAMRALRRQRPRVALLASQAAARLSLLSLGKAAHPPHGDPDVAVLIEVAAASRRQLAAQPAERLRLIHSLLSVMGRMFPRMRLAQGQPPAGPLAEPDPSGDMLPSSMAIEPVAREPDERPDGSLQRHGGSRSTRRARARQPLGGSFHGGVRALTAGPLSRQDGPMLRQLKQRDASRHGEEAAPKRLIDALVDVTRRRAQLAAMFWTFGDQDGQRGAPRATVRIGAREALQGAIDLIEAECRRIEAADDGRARLIAAEPAGPTMTDVVPDAGDACLPLILENAIGHAIYTLDPAGRVTSWTEGARQLFGWEASEMLGHTPDRLVPPEARSDDRPAADMLDRAEVQHHVEIEGWRLRKDGSRFWASGVLASLRDAAGTLRGFVVIKRDRTEARRELAQTEIPLRALNHRVEDTLPGAPSAAAQAVRSSGSSAILRDAFGPRLTALAEAHDMLDETRAGGAALEPLVHRVLTAHVTGDRAGRISVDGPPVLLPPDATVSVWLALQELATNAVKHGSLSVPEGRVAVTWALERRPEMADPVVTLTWREWAGPPVRPPSRRGFGTRMIERELALEFGGDVQLDFAPSGVECHMWLPIPRIRVPEGDPPDSHACLPASVATDTVAHHLTAEPEERSILDRSDPKTARLVFRDLSPTAAA
ncbi:PAS domain S-box protein [Neoroseomonas lacus]|uniref:histidine kinase n=1 Tax=Neoroseomonas lacus TaxID=287609 RepID=A0A917L231_9PROT|nr:PAS domain S-box protein [Neoroseomonas lacus]GGJ38523.1 hypothetical protein GCM10011320_52690 [Neoroseomonas lacus]